MEIVNDEKVWNEKIISQQGSFLQSWEWGELHKSLGRKVLRITDDKWYALAVQFQLPLGRTYWSVSHGPSGEVNKKILEVIKHDLKLEKSMFLRIEPPQKENDELRKILTDAQFKKTKSVQPEETIIIDLIKSEEKLLSEMEHDTRYAIRAATRHGVIINHYKTAEEKKERFELFWKLFKETNERHQLDAYARPYYEYLFGLEGECHTHLFCAELNGEVIATAIILFYGAQAIYLYAGSRKGYGKYNAPSALLWSALHTAKKDGFKLMDLWGISTTNPKWKGITSFKKSFGGEVIKRMGTWEYVEQSLWYYAYQIAKKVL